MEISVTFNPQLDALAAVVAAVTAAYGQPAPAASMFTEAEELSQAMALTISGAGGAPLVAPAVASASTTLTLPGAASVPAASGSLELDANGVPYDPRIHSGAVGEDGKPKKTSKGVWNKRKGVPDIEYQTIHKELLNMMAGAIGTAAAPTALPAGGVLGNPTLVPHQEAVPTPTDPNAFVIAQPTTMLQDVQAAEAATVVTPAPLLSLTLPPVAPPTPTDFNSLIGWLTPQLAPMGKLTQEHVQFVASHFGLANIQSAQARPDLIEALHTSFVNIIGQLG